MSKGGKGKRKGSGFERKVCEQLSRWIDPDSDETLFWRSAMSGGRATNRFKKQGIKSSNQAGDITAVHEKGNKLTDDFAIECKFYRDLNIQSAFLSNKGKLARFWEEICEVAGDHRKQPMLIAKENNTPILFIVTPAGRGILFLKNPDIFWNTSDMKACVYGFEKLLEGGSFDHPSDKRFAFRQQSTKRRSVEPVPVAKEANKKARDKATVDTRGHHKRKRPARRIPRE